MGFSIVFCTQLVSTVLDVEPWDFEQSLAIVLSFCIEPLQTGGLMASALNWSSKCPKNERFEDRS